MTNNIETLLKRVDRTQQPVRLMQTLVLLSRSYLDGLCNHYNYTPRKELRRLWQRQLYGLESLLNGSRACAAGLYLNEPTVLVRAKEAVSSAKDEIMQFACPNSSLTPSAIASGAPTYVHFNEVIKNVVPDLGIDTVVYISSGGLESGCIVANILEDANLLPVRYSPAKCNDKLVKMPMAKSYIADRVTGKSVIVVDDWSSSGVTLKEVLGFITGFKPSELYSAAVITDVWPTFIPGAKLIYPQDIDHSKADPSNEFGSCVCRYNLIP